jgi:hypothetical protein
VKVVGSAATELQVNEGEVAYVQGGVTGTLQAGKAMRLERTKAPQAIAGETPRFGQLVREANPRGRPDLMIVYDGFHYAEGSYPPKSIGGGKGWAGPWRLRSEQEMIGRRESDTTSDMHIVQGQPILPWRMNRGAAGMLAMPAGFCVRVRPMTLPLEMNRDGVTYFSLITQEPVRAEPDKRTKVESIRLTFRSSADFAGDFLTFAMGRIRSPTSAGRRSVKPRASHPFPMGKAAVDWENHPPRRGE